MKTRGTEKINYEVVTHHMWVAPETLRFNAGYQRAIEKPRLKKIEGKIKNLGYKPHEVVAITEKGDIVDGQHRVKAAINLVVEQIPVTVYKFGSVEDEAKFFVDCNDHNTNLNNIYYWDAKKKAGDSLAEFIYALESDPMSVFTNNIRVKGKNSKNKFSIPETLSFIAAAFNIGYNAWVRDNDHTFKKALASNSYTNNREKVNEVGDFFHGCFGPEKESNPMAFKTKTIRPFCAFFRLLKRQGLADKSAAKKMKGYVFTNEFNKLTEAGKVFSFVDFLNSGRTKNRAEYVITNGQ